MPSELTDLFFLQEFDHHAFCGLGMEERDQAMDAGARVFVDEAEAAGAQFSERHFDVVDGKADVVGALAASSKESGGAAVVAVRRKEFDRALAGVEEGDLDTVVGGIGALEQAEAEEAAVGCERRVYAMDDDTDMVKLGVGELQWIPLHQSDSPLALCDGAVWIGLLLVGIDAPAGQIYILA